MALKAKLSRAELTKRINRIEPNILKASAESLMASAQEAAEGMRQRAPKRSGKYATSIVADWQRDNPDKRSFGDQQTKDPNAVGIYANWIWRFLEFGTAPHSLAKGGGTVAGKKSATGPISPGTEKRPHIFPVWREMKKKIRRRQLAAINKAIKGPSGHVD